MPKDEEADKFWRPPPRETLSREERQQRADAAAAAAGLPMSLPHNRYGHGLNSLQLAVELSGRALLRAHGESSSSRKRPSASDDQLQQGAQKKPAPRFHNYET